jgi:alkylation response protein AidB-like acyl-CoA dehydrogenase
MDFDDSPEEAAFRAEARSWLASKAQPKRSGPAERTLTDANTESEREHLRQAKWWQRTLYDGGWAGITWPSEYGGRGGTPVQQVIFDEEQARFDVSVGTFANGIGVGGPILITYGTEAQKSRYLKPMLRGDEIWCQLFSEPEAGSDLAGLRTRAVRDGDEFVVNGQKVWNSGAHYSDWAILLARTNIDVPKHRGISFLLLDMRTPGIEIHPLRQITGSAHFNQVFLKDVRIPADNVVGDIDDGWRITNNALSTERVYVGSSTGITFSDLLGLAQEFRCTEDPLLRDDISRAYIGFEILRFFRLRLRSAISRGQHPGPESSILKIMYTRHVTALGNLSMRIQGATGMLFGPDAFCEGSWQVDFLSQWAARIGGGTEEIQRNLIGERVLQLPREPRSGLDTPFKDLGPDL